MPFSGPNHIFPSRFYYYFLCAIAVQVYISNYVVYSILRVTVVLARIEIDGFVSCAD